MKPKVIITKKNIKNLIMKIKGDGNIYISSPMFLNDKYIYEFIAKKENWINKKLKEFSLKPKPKVVNYSNNCKIYYLGNPYFLNLKSSNNKTIYISNNKINLDIQDISDAHLIENTLNSWYKEQGEILFEEILSKYLKLTHLNISKFNIKTLKSKWGSCNYNKKIINLNLELMKKDIRFVEYVILHEISHLVHPNHSKNFYNYIEKFMPDWRERKSL